MDFRNATELTAFYAEAMRQEDLQITETQPESMTLKWQNRIISNYDYLLYLNRFVFLLLLSICAHKNVFRFYFISLADRTFQDLTQYPIFPWIISDYTSAELNLNDERSYRDLTKPIGALNPERLSRLKERCDEMGEPKY